MATDAEIQEILDQNEPGVNQAAFDAYERAAAGYFTALSAGQQLVVSNSTAGR